MGNNHHHLRDTAVTAVLQVMAQLNAHAQEAIAVLACMHMHMHMVDIWCVHER